MKIAKKKAVTKSKGKKFCLEFDDDDLQLWEANPLNEYTAKRLGDLVNWHLKQAYLKRVVEYRYSAHKFRHFVAIKTLKETGEVFEVVKKLKHKHVATTENYLEGLQNESL